MASSTANYDRLGNSPSGLGRAPSFAGGRRYRLLEKLRQRGYSAKSFRQKYSIGEPDLSHYLRGRRDRVGRKVWRKIDDVLIAEGLLKPRKLYPKLPCPTCGRLMREDAPLRLESRLNSWLAQSEEKIERGSVIRKKGRTQRNRRLDTVPLLRRIPENLEWA